MKINELLISKEKVAFVFENDKIGHVVSTMRKYRYRMIPVLEKKTGRYLYSISYEDILGKVADDGNIKCFKGHLDVLTPTRCTIACQEDKEIDDVVDLLANQNYVPIVSSEGVFLGIVTRKEFIYHLLKQNRRK